MNLRQKRKRTKRGGFFHYDKTLMQGLKKGYFFPWVSKQGLYPTCWCKPGQCLICKHCSDIFLDWNGPYGIVCILGNTNVDRCNNGICSNFTLDTNIPLMSIDDRKHLDEYIDKIRKNEFEGDNISTVPSQLEDDLFDDIEKYLVEDPVEYSKTHPNYVANIKDNDGNTYIVRDGTKILIEEDDENE